MSGMFGCAHLAMKPRHCSDRCQMMYCGMSRAGQTRKMWSRPSSVGWSACHRGEVFEMPHVKGCTEPAPTRERELTGNGTRGPFVLRRWPDILKEARMRIPTLTILMIATVLTAAPARAQTYDPAYPVCLQIYQGWNDYYFECAYTSLPQCNMSASGRAAQCIINPYYAGRKTAPPG